MNKISFMFDFINDCVPVEIKRLFTFNSSIHSYETRLAKGLHIQKGTTSRFGLNTLRYDGAVLWNQFYKDILHEETNVTKPKLKSILKKYFSSKYL